MSEVLSPGDREQRSRHLRQTVSYVMPCERGTDGCVSGAVDARSASSKLVPLTEAGSEPLFGGSRDDRVGVLPLHQLGAVKPVLRRANQAPVHRRMVLK